MLLLCGGVLGRATSHCVVASSKEYPKKKIMSVYVTVYCLKRAHSPPRRRLFAPMVARISSGATSAVAAVVVAIAAIVVGAAVVNAAVGIPPTGGNRPAIVANQPCGLAWAYAAAGCCA